MKNKSKTVARGSLLMTILTTLRVGWSLARLILNLLSLIQKILEVVKGML